MSSLSLRHWPVHGWVGLFLVAVCWPANWLLPGLRTHLLFFPLWLGYALTVDALVHYRSGTSIIARSTKGFVLLFLASIPTWWLFETLNLRLHNWTYIGREHFTDLEYAVLASISFSTVIPAVFETADLWRTLRWTARRGRGVAITPRVALTIFSAGLACLALLLAFPRYAFPLTWVSAVLILDPIAWKLGRSSLLDRLHDGDFQTLLTLPLGAITCGFFWEMWNWHSYPHWVYDIPFVDFWYLFRMPALGYLGYLPFGLELYPMAHLLIGRRVSETLDW